MGYIFYDTETTGLNPAFDQILQFAALEVDDQLNEISSINIRCRILPYIVPSPQALLITKVSPQMLVDADHSYNEMAQKVHAWITQRSPAIIAGHNSIKFDEDFVRHKFYQNLLPIYLTNTNGNRRADTMRMAQAAHIFAPGSINVPISDKGRPTFRLGDLARANGINLSEENAHDALADVRATLELARLIKHKAPEVWVQMHLTSAKKDALEFMRKTDYFYNAEVYFGSPSTHLVAALVSNPDNDAEMAVFDLAYNPAEYLTYSVEQLLEAMKGPTRSIRVIAANKQPMMFDPRVNALSLSHAPETLNRYVQQLKTSPEFLSRVAEALKLRYEEKQPSPHVEERIFEGFPSKEDAWLMQRFHKSPIHERSAICNSLSDERFRELGMRLIYLEDANHLSQQDRSLLEDYFKRKLLTSEEAIWLTIPRALEEIAALRKQGADEDSLSEIESFIQSMKAKFQPAQ